MDMEQQLPLPSVEAAIGTSRDSDVIPVRPRISNMVCGVNLDCRIDYEYIANSAPYYDPDDEKKVYHHNNAGPAKGSKGRFPAAVVRIKEPKATALVFNSGKMQVLGSKSVDDAKLSARKFARRVEKMGFQPRLRDFVVQNIVADVDTKMCICLESLALQHRLFARYEPEIFPGLVYRMISPKVTFLIFAKGKVLILGAKKREEIDEAFQKMWWVIREHRRE